MKIEDRNKKFYTEEGLSALEHRVQSWIDAYNKDIFPFEAQMLGFGKFKIDNKEECESRIKELCELEAGVPVRNFDLIEYYKFLEEVIKFRKNVEHKKIKKVSGEKVDEFLNKAERYVKQMRRIYTVLQNKRKRDIIDRNYEILLKSTIYTLKKLNKLPPDPKDLPKAIKKEIIDKKYLPKSYLVTFEKVISMKKIQEKDLVKIPERDIELTRSYVKKFVDMLGRTIKSKEPIQNK